MEINKRILAGLDRMGIEYEIISHPPAHTMEECALPERLLGGVMPKNLFLRPRRQEEFYLCVARADAPFKTSVVSKQAGASRLGFASEEELYRLLLTRPGAISPLALMLEEAGEVSLLVDKSLKDEERLIFHPCVNTYSVALSGKDFFEKFLPAVGHSVTWVVMSPDGDSNQ